MIRLSRNLYVETRLIVSLAALLAALAIAAGATRASAAPPVLTVPPAQTVSEQQLLAFGVSAFDPDGQTTTLQAFSKPVGATFVDNHDNTGSFAWTPASDQSGSYTVQFRADDTFGGIDNEYVSITVLNANAPPSMGAISDRLVDPGTMAILSLWATDDDGDPLSFGASGLPAWGEFTDYGDNTASIVLAPPMGTPPGTWTITVTVTDGKDPVSQSFQVTVTGTAVTHAPVLDPFAEPTVAEGASASVALSATDVDGDALVWTSGLPSFASLTTLTSAPGSTTARLDLAPGYCAAGNYAATVGVNDGALLDSQSFTIHVTDTPRTPAWSAPTEGASVSLAVGSALSIDLAAADPDQACGGAAPLLSLAASDAGGALSLSLLATGPGAGSLSVQANGPGGVYHVTLRASDGADPGRYAERVVTVTAEDVARAAEAVAWLQPKQIRSETGSDWQRVYLEPLAGTFSLDDLDPASFRLTAWAGAGNGGELAPKPDGVTMGFDSNENGVLECRLTFDKKELCGLFGNLTAPTDGLMTMTARLLDGGLVRAAVAAKFVPEKKRAIKRCGPNPLNPEATVAIETEQPGRLRVMVFDVQGRMVRLLLDEANAPAGTREVTFNGKDNRGRALRAGRYFVRVESPSGPDATTLTILP
ncbi:MAG TPA: Ig-like domain-containing protein [Candidatus Eisenbacteria bacterium]|nr:Ig-like domain-containing protein [Candidatus Eisenbacteria bacterium]